MTPLPSVVVVVVVERNGRVMEEKKKGVVGGCVGSVKGMNGEEWQKRKGKVRSVKEGCELDSGWSEGQRLKRKEGTEEREGYILLSLPFPLPLPS